MTSAVVSPPLPLTHSLTHSLIPQQSQRTCTPSSLPPSAPPARGPARRAAARPPPKKFAPDGRECQSEAKIRRIKSGGGKKFGERATGNARRANSAFGTRYALNCATGKKRGRFCMQNVARCENVVQGWAKEWSLGCVNSHPTARGSQEAGFMQPRDHSRAQRCIRTRSGM